MKISKFTHERDFDRINDFLFSLYRPMNRDGNWIQPIWEYAYTHAWLDDRLMKELPIWEENNEIMAFVYYDSNPLDLTLAVHPDHNNLKIEMIKYAQSYLYSVLDDGKRTTRIFTADFDSIGRKSLESRGFVQKTGLTRDMSWFDPSVNAFDTRLPTGFKFKSLAEDNNLKKIDLCLHKGFNHEGDPPENGIAGRLKMQSGPHFRKDLNIVVEAPSGEFVSFAGLWMDEINKFGYVEPVATVPEYRNRGIGRSAVLESVRRCCELGATGAWVWTKMNFYLSMGFQPVYQHLCFENVV